MLIIIIIQQKYILHIHKTNRNIVRYIYPSFLDIYPVVAGLLARAFL